jgi:acyl-CoA thioester hydrolase
VAEPFTHSFRVRYAECDVQGVVFNSHYLAFVDIVITELWREAFGGYAVMLDRGVDVVVAEANLRFHSPARFDDTVTVSATITHLGTTSIVSQHRLNRDDETLVEADIRHVMVDRESMVKTPIPDWARSGLARWTVPAPA